LAVLGHRVGLAIAPGELVALPLVVVVAVVARLELASIEQHEPGLVVVAALPQVIGGATVGAGQQLGPAVAVEVAGQRAPGPTVDGAVVELLDRAAGHGREARAAGRIEEGPGAVAVV